MSDVAIKIPLPEGTRFLEAGAEPATSASFDGREVTFFTSAFHRPIRNAFFTVEVTNPTRTDFTTHAWITWKGDQPGDYLTGDVTIDITREPLDWASPPTSALQLNAMVIAADDILTYYIYPQNTNWRRMWDLKINTVIPEGTTFLAAEAPPPFVANFDGREVSFSIVELERVGESTPLKFRVSTTDAAADFLVTRAWASWKNVGRGVGQTIVPQEETITGDIVVQSQVVQHVIADPSGDVPFANYDLTSVAFIENETNLQMNFYTAGNIEPIQAALEYTVYVDQDCNIATGAQRRGLGAEYVVSYDHQTGRAEFIPWSQDRQRWDRSAAVALDNLVAGQMVAIWVPYQYLKNSQQFCWIARADNRMKAYKPAAPSDWTPDRNLPELTQYEAIREIVEFATFEPVVTDLPTPIPVTEPAVDLAEGYLIEVGYDWHYLKGYGEASYPPAAWQQIEYDDTAWLVGPTSIGYGDGNETTELNDMRYNYGSIFMRHSLDILDPTLVQSLILQIDYDDGFVAYLNGTEVARRNVVNNEQVLAYDSLAISSREAGNPEAIDISSFIDRLLPGKNVVAIQGFNDRLHSPDFSLSPALQSEYLLQPAATTTQAEDTELTETEDKPVVDIPIYYGPDLPAPSHVSTFQPTDISGKLAVPIDNGLVSYDLHIFSLPDGRELTRISNARQPNFHGDGQRLLINQEGGGIENVYEYNLTNNTATQVSDAPRDSFPFYDPSGNRVVYSNPELIIGADGQRHPFIFTQCGLQPPHREVEPRCRDIPSLGVLVPAGQMGEIQGSHPVWTADDMIAYKGCNTWAGSRLCGIYIVPSASTKGLSTGFIPQQLTEHPDDTPSDTKGNMIAFTSFRDGDWEVYVMDLNGTGITNLSNSSNSRDGLPTISPDGNYIAFASDRDGQWAIWVIPINGGEPRKLFDLPTTAPWGDGDRAWINERISWGP